MNKEEFEEKSSLNLMKSSYGHLFIIENTLRKIINHKLSNTYGGNWIFFIRKKYKNNLTKKDIHQMYFHEMISFILLIPELKDDLGSLCDSLYKIIPIRNSIAHCILIDEQEYCFLNSVSVKIQMTYNQVVL
ncbi:hypothetical protein [Guptibacillus algicola]|uniref:hypothetical protein n=1 Tax=Guptibacillus algicola TaxID=225844 RepID=UPI001CD80FC4|nr:hypothetical protein [Alkalihalobacillus algicola]MCA0987260.1 hypothetical protein [Alkalihalobacillus algicola]